MLSMKTPGKLKFVVVDDDPRMCEVVKKILESCFDSDAYCALNGRRGYWLTWAVRPDLVILDLKMPGMDGFEVLRRLKSGERTCDISVIMLTGHDEEKNVEQAMRDFADAFLAKPCRTDELIEAVTRSLATRRRLQMTNLSGTQRVAARNTNPLPVAS